MIKTTFNFTIICDNCKKEKTYTKDNQESFVIDLLKDGYFVIKGKNKTSHFCSKECKEMYNE
jgi:hypothetical protein